MRSIKLLNPILTLASCSALAISASANSYVVPGTSDPWLARAAIDNLGTPEAPDVAPFQSPVLAGSVTPGSTITWSAAGIVGHPGDNSGPDGGPLASRIVGAANGISDLPSTPINALIGVWALSGGGGTSFLMGSSGSAVAPAGAVELYMGTMDGYGWANNTGEFRVDVNGVPDAGSSAGLALIGLTLLGLYRRNVTA
ncbi:MAG: hypothetical protein HYR88_14775 [Verrucomicrobia bacterium]|nr:hypothetical protein [Verrucomicrobiota bacterium]